MQPAVGEDVGGRLGASKSKSRARKSTSEDVVAVAFGGRGGSQRRPVHEVLKKYTHVFVDS